MVSFTAAMSTGELGAFDRDAIIGLCSASHLLKPDEVSCVADALVTHTHADKKQTQTQTHAHLSKFEVACQAAVQAAP